MEVTATMHAKRNDIIVSQAPLSPTWRHSDYFRPFAAWQAC
jgi:hypothetical protein